MTEESLLQGKVSENGGGFYAASRIASMGLNSCALHLETGDAFIGQLKVSLVAF